MLIGTRTMGYPKMADPETGQKVPDRTRLIYNSHLTLSGIPLRAHEYVLGTRSGIDWIIDRYYVKTDSASGIVNDPNQWALERGEPRYIIDLIKRVVTVLAPYCRHRRWAAVPVVRLRAIGQEH